MFARNFSYKKILNYTCCSKCKDFIFHLTVISLWSQEKHQVNRKRKLFNLTIPVLKCYLLNSVSGLLKSVFIEKRKLMKKWILGKCIFSLVTFWFLLKSQRTCTSTWTLRPINNYLDMIYLTRLCSPNTYHGQKLLLYSYTNNA